MNKETKITDTTRCGGNSSCWNEGVDPRTENDVEMTPTEDKPGLSDDKSVSESSRFAKTHLIFEQTGLLECAMETATLCKENEKLQEQINILRKQVNDANLKTRDDLQNSLGMNKEHLMTIETSNSEKHMKTTS